MEYYPPDPPVPVRRNWVKIGMVAIIIILILTIFRRAGEISKEIQRIDSEIEEEAKDCLKKFSSLNCPLQNTNGTDKCGELYSCARKTKSVEHIQSFLEKAAYVAIFEVSREAVFPIVVIAIIVALKLIQKFE